MYLILRYLRYSKFGSWIALGGPSPKEETMKMRLPKLLHAIALVAIMSFVYAPAARATAALELYDGASCSTSDCIEITDSGTVTVIHGTASATGVVTSPGFVNATVSVGSVFTLNVDTGESKPVLGPGSMDLTTNDVIGSGSGTLTVLFSDINFTVPATGSGQIQATGGTTVTPGVTSLVYNTWASASNSLFATSNLQTSLSYAAPGSFQSAIGGLVPPSGTTTPPGYSLTQQLEISVSGSGHTSGDFTLDVVPEPAGVVLLGTAILFSVSAIRRKLGQGKRA
jgi:hypothetical protein